MACLSSGTVTIFRKYLIPGFILLMAFNLLEGLGLLRRQVLYPAELRAHMVVNNDSAKTVNPKTLLRGGLFVGSLLHSPGSASPTHPLSVSSLLPLALPATAWLAVLPQRRLGASPWLQFSASVRHELKSWWSEYSSDP